MISMHITYMTMLITLSILSLSMNMFLMLSPLSMGITILFMALTVALFFSYSMSSWIAFLIFLIYIGGMLVMFSYFVSLTPNQTTNMLYMLITTMISMFTLSLFTLMLNMKTHPMFMHSIQSNMFYLKQNNPTLMLLALILLITMIIVVKLTISNKGPLRPFYK